MNYYLWMDERFRLFGYLEDHQPVMGTYVGTMDCSEEDCIALLTLMQDAVDIALQKITQQAKQEIN